MISLAKMKIFLFLFAIFLPQCKILALKNIEKKVFRDFKALMMYYNEPLLLKAKLNSLQVDGRYYAGFEGESDSIMADLLCLTINNAAGKLDERVIKFANYLKLGNDLMKPVPLTIKDIEINARELQKNLLEQLKKHGKIIIPTGWLGSAPHAIALIIERNNDNTFNLIVANTGDGIEYHFTSKDSNQIYPKLYRLWIKFENILEKDIFSDNNWFMYPLITMQIKDTIKQIETASSSVAQYFYGSILNNFAKYMAKVDKSDNKMAPPQRSGSCALSSLMAAYLYFAKDDLEYRKNRVIIGHRFLHNFIISYKKDPNFLSLITDSFDVISRKLWESTISAVANQLFLYFEFRFPASFKCAGLLGSGRSKWIETQKDKAVKDLIGSPELALLKDAVNYGLQIADILSKNPIDKNTSNIKVNSAMRNIYSARYNIDSYRGEWNLHETEDMTYMLSGAPDRQFSKIENIEDLASRLKNCRTKNVAYKSMICVRDVFDCYYKKDWWNDLDKLEPKLAEKYSRSILSEIRLILLAYLPSATNPVSLDENVTLAHLQLAIWKCAVVYDNTREESLKLNLSNFKPPPIVENLMSKSIFPITTIVRISWPIRTVFSAKNFDDLHYLLKNYSTLTTGNETFFGITDFLYYPSLQSCIFSQEVNKKLLTGTNDNAKAYNKMLNHEIIAKKIHDFRQLNAYRDKKWLTDEYASVSILFSILQKDVAPYFVHFFYLMESSAVIYKRFAQIPKTFGKEGNAIFSKSPELHSFVLNVDKEQEPYVKKFTVNGTYDDFNSFIPNGSVMKTSNNYRNIFTSLRHQQLVMPFIVCFESWLNYVKGSPDAKVFDDDHFVYLSDRLLNMPNIKMNSQGELQTEKNVIYPQGFEGKHIKLIYKAFIGHIETDTNELVKNSFKMTSSERGKLLKRTINMSISLVKFIGRVDYDKMLPAHVASKMLADVYGIFYKFGSLSNGYNFDETQISKVNILLTLICDIPIRNPKTFLNLISGYLPDKKLIPFRKTLARVHWFIAKLYYSSMTPGFDHADDIFDFGFFYYPVAKNEVEFMDSLLKVLFLSKHVPNPDNATIRYTDFGYLVLIKCDDINLVVQLSKGLVIKNGKQLVEKSQVINSDTFKNFFTGPMDQMIASQGETYKIGSILLYVLSDFKVKNSKIAILCMYKNCSLYRKYKNNWFMWVEDTSLYKTSVKYNLIDNHKLYERLDSDNGGEAIMMRDDENEPLNFIRNNSKQINYSLIGISDFAGEKLWKLLHGDKKEYLFFENHLQHFTQSETLAAISMNDDAFVVIYTGLRLPNYPKYPLVLVEMIDKSKKYNDFKVMNSPNLIIEASQVAYNGSGIAGTLVAKNSEGQRFILTPRILMNNEKYSFIESIPIVDKQPAPQTRLQRLTLAYYCIEATEFSLARELLHPFTSINQNEPFNEAERTAIDAIIRIKSGHPIKDALKLMTYMHSFINTQKFPLEGMDKNQAQPDLLAEAGLMSYLMAIRELPEKFYVHRIFPEFFDPKNVAEMMKYARSNIHNISTTNVNLMLTDYNGKADEFTLDDLNLGKVTSENIIDLLECIFRNDGSETKYLNLMSKLGHKNENELLFTNENIVHCVALDKNLFMESAKLYYDTDSIWDCFDLIERAMKECTIKFAEQLQKFDATLESTYTEPELIFTTLKEDVKSSYDLPSGQFESSNVIDLVKKDDETAFNDLIKSIKSVLKLDFKRAVTGFTKENLKCPVLRKLQSSIDKFTDENGQHVDIEIDLKSSTELNLQFRGLRLFLEGRISVLNEESLEMTRELMKKISFVDFDDKPLTHLIDDLNRMMHSRKLKSFSNLYACYQRLSPHCIQNKFPQLEFKDCEQILVDSMKYYSTQILIDYLSSILESVERILKLTQLSQSVPIDELTLIVDEVDKINFFNERLKTPSILNFEYRSKQYRLRTEQVEDIKTLTTVDDKTGMFKSAVIQRMMAAGKTLVLGTISVVKKALDSAKLSILVPPSSLYQSNLSAMQARTYNFFKTKGHGFIFPRFNVGSEKRVRNEIIPFLKNILDNINRIQNSKDYYVLGPESLQSFLNSYIETLNFVANDAKSAESQDYKELLKLYAQIYTMFRTRASIILDEIDMTMDPKKELNFPTEENEPFNLDAATLITDLIEFSVFSKKVREIGLDIFGNNQSGLTSVNYTKYRDLLLEYIKDQLNDGKSIWSQILIVPNLISKEEIMEFLQKDEMQHMKSWILKIYKAKKKIIANALIIIKVQIHNNLQEALKATANLNFGAAGSNRQQIHYAVPYLAANTPSASSEFADRWETLNKTLLMFASVPCTESIAQKMIGYVRKRILNESVINTKLEDTSTFKMVATLIPGIDAMELNDDNPQDVKTLHKALKTRSPTAIRLLFSYALDEIFSNMKFPIEQITCNALNMTSMFGSIQGYSGTIDNVNILPREVVAGAYDNHLKNEKNNGAIALKLIKDSRDANSVDKPVAQISDEELRKSVDKIVKIMINKGIPDKHEQNDLSALIDTGALFKSFKNQEVAIAILNHLNHRIHAVVYYDEDTNQVEFVKKVDGGPLETGHISGPDPDSFFKATQTDLKKQFTFYDQRHITGSDILQPKNARALMTISTRILLRDILQGTLRMRQFMTSQKVHLITSVSAAQFYFSKAFPSEPSDKFTDKAVTVADIITLGAFNESDKQTIENEKLAFAKIDNEVRRFILEEVSRALLKDSSSSVLVDAIFSLHKNESRNIRNLFIRLIRENPLGWMSKLRRKKSKLVLRNYSNSCIENIEAVFEELAKTSPEFNLNKDSNTITSQNFTNLKEALDVLTSSEKSLKKTKETLLAFVGPDLVERRRNQEAGGEVEMQIFTEQISEFELESLISEYDGVVRKEKLESVDLSKLSSQKVDATIASVKDANVISLQTLFKDKNKASSDVHYKMTSTVFLTEGDHLGVDSDLTHFVTGITTDSSDIIFSKYTLEGSHILIQVLPKLDDKNNGIRAILLSTQSALYIWGSLIEKPSRKDLEDSYYWLCDLSGNVTASSDPKTDHNMNIFDIIPASQKLFFDLLIFNGSLHQILVSEKMRKLYHEEWLDDENCQYRTMFLLTRMKVLADLAKSVFSDNNEELKMLKDLVGGKKTDVKQIKKLSILYNKPAIEEDIEKAHFGTLPRPSIKKIVSESDDLNTAEIVFKEITGLSVVVEQPIPDYFLNDLNTATIPVDEGEVITDCTDYFKEPIHPTVTTWDSISVPERIKVTRSNTDHDEIVDGFVDNAEDSDDDKDDNENGEDSDEDKDDNENGEDSDTDKDGTDSEIKSTPTTPISTKTTNTDTDTTITGKDVNNLKPDVINNKTTGGGNTNNNGTVIGVVDPNKTTITPTPNVTNTNNTGTGTRVVDPNMITATPINILNDDVNNNTVIPSKPSIKPSESPSSLSITTIIMISVFILIGALFIGYKLFLAKPATAVDVPGESGNV